MTGAQNKWNIDVKKDNIKDSATVRILGYNYEITKTANKDNVSNFAEYGDNIQYTIAIKNTGSTKIKNVEIEDIISSELENITISGKNWSSIGSNKYKYTGTIEAGGTETLKINAEIKADAIKESDDKILNTATISKVKNKKNIDITDRKTSTVEFKFLGYKIDLKKYIIGVSADRSGWENTGKYNSPVVVKKGEHITYKIEFKNNSETAELKEIKIEDILPDGLRYIEKGGNVSWKKAGNIYEYDGKVQKGDTITLEITAEVTMSNMYLFNIENVATTAQVLNKNKQNINDLTIVANQKANWKNRDYIRMDELDISGTVWNDANKDGLINNKEKGIPGIEVVLHNFDGGKDSIVLTVKTDSDGKYTFSKVQKGLIRESNGNYENKAGQGYKKYYIQYIYNGVTYQSTTYAGKGNIKADGTIENKYKIDSNAAERIDLREEFNKSLETISYNKASDSEGNTKDLSYTKDGTISTLNLTESTQISAFSFVDTQQGYPSFDNLIWLGGSYSGSMSGYNVMENTDYLGYINLGLINKKVDLELTSTVETISQTINGQRQKYIRADSINHEGTRIEQYQLNLYKADYDYRYDKYGDIDIRNAKTKESELNVEIEFKTTITNKEIEGSNIYAKVNEVAQYYAEEFLPVYKNGTELNKVGMKIDTDDDGIFEKEEEYKYEVTYIYKDETGEIKGTGTAHKSSKFGTYLSTAPTGYNVVYLSGFDNIVLKPGETLELYTTYIIDKDENRNLKIDTTSSTDFDVISEINAYSTYYSDKTTPAGSVDIDSNPGNVGLNENGTGPTAINEREESIKCYEDDTRLSMVTVSVINSGRKIKGTVWEDIANEEVDGQKIGNGKLENSENRIKNVEVQLYEVVPIKNGTEYEYREVETKTGIETDDEGNYTIEGFVPGMYMVRFKYGGNKGDLKYNGQDYKSTTYYYKQDDSAVPKNLSGTTNSDINEANKNREIIAPSKIQGFPTDETDSTIIETARSSEERYSDARDDEKRRLEVMEYSVEMFNEKAEVLKGANSSNPEELAEKAYMEADTAVFLAKIENIPSKTKVTLEDKLIFLGQTDNHTTSFWYKYNENGKPLEEIMKDKIYKNGGEIHCGTKGLWDEWARNDETYLRKYVIENIDFGLQKRPENNIELKKYIKEIKLETSAGNVLVDAKYDENSEPILEESKGMENLQALNNTADQQGFRYINVDEELLQGAKITIIYGFVVTNNSEIDHISVNLYGDETAIANLSTNEVKKKIDDAKANVDYSKKYTESEEYYGRYLGGIYYRGKQTNDVMASIKIDNILDYVDNNLVFSPIDNNGKWGTTLATELISNGYLKEDVYKFVQEDESSIEMIADINGVEYQTDTKNNLAITIDDPSANTGLFKYLYPQNSGKDQTASTELMVSTFLSSENESDDMVYENIAEIIKFTTLTGRRTTDIETVGNAKVNYVGYINSDASLAEPDTSIVEKIMLTPPTGLSKNENITQIITRITIYVLTSIALIILIIVYAPKIIIKIKDRKFIK